jgi:hypothetical protein
VPQFEQGHEKLGGREKGTKNKKTIIFERTFERCDAQDFHPVDALIELAKSGNPQTKLAALTLLLERLEGKQKDGTPIKSRSPQDSVDIAKEKSLDEEWKPSEPNANPVT